MNNVRTNVCVQYSSGFLVRNVGSTPTPGVKPGLQNRHGSAPPTLPAKTGKHPFWSIQSKAFNIVLTMIVAFFFIMHENSLFK